MTLLVGLGGRPGGRILIWARVLIGGGNAWCLVRIHSGVSWGATGKRVLDLVMGVLCWVGVVVPSGVVCRLIEPFIARYLGREALASDAVPCPLADIAYVRIYTAVTPRTNPRLRAWLRGESTGESVWRARAISGGRGYIGMLKVSL